MTCAPCLKARAALHAAGAAALHGDAQEAAKQAAAVLAALREKAATESDRVRALLRRR